METETDLQHLRRALELATRGPAVDPNPRVGAVIVDAAGRVVGEGWHCGAGTPHAEPMALNEAWTFAMRHGRPRVIWKTATTLDGRSAAADGTSQWITSSEARAEVHRLRAMCGAILVGTGTALADNPRLTVRGIDTHRQPLRVVLGERELPDDLATHPLLHLRHRDPGRALAELHARGVRQVLLEGGSTLATAFLRAGLIDRVVWHLAPTLLGAGPALGDFGVGTLADALALTIESVHRAGPDLIAIADVRTTRPRKEQGCSQG